jgi:hypothetical protein
MSLTPDSGTGMATMTVLGGRVERTAVTLLTAEPPVTLWIARSTDNGAKGWVA